MAAPPTFFTPSLFAARRNLFQESAMAHEHYRKALHELQIGLVALQRHVIAQGSKILVIFEGRDAAGKDGLIKRISEHMSPRDVRIVALGKPTEHEHTEWYFQRYVGHLPAAGEIALFNRSWYNRAGVEHVMDFCTPREYHDFLEAAPRFERMLTQAGIRITKYYLDISKKEQARRFKRRHKDPLRQWKISPIDESAQKHWGDYSRARDRMLRETTHDDAPWYVVRSDDKHTVRLNVIRHLLSKVNHPDKNTKLGKADEEVVRTFNPSLIKQGWMEP
jgi:polyphosphate kinase 2